MNQFRRQPSHNPFKPVKVMVLPEDGNISCFRVKSLKPAVAFLPFIASIFLVLYFAFRGDSRSWFRCPECPFRTEEIVPAGAYGSNMNDDLEPTNISHIVFGIAGFAQTWEEQRDYSEVWWQRNVTRGFAWLDEQPDPYMTLTENSLPYRISSDWRKFKNTGSDSAVRIARMVVDSFRVGFPNVRWFVMGDNDTVFFLDNLVTVLGKYDHREMYYVGGNSESVEQNVMHAYDMAFAGGGFAISYPLAARLVSIMDGCLDRYYNLYGSDQRVWACVGELGVSLTLERGFHQMDIRGHPFGLLAAHPLAPLVSLHNLDSFKTLFPGQTQLESLRTPMQPYRLDPARTIQQCLCYHQERKWLWPSISWSISISWGYVVQIYPFFLSAKELETPLQTFKTWRSWEDGPFTFITRALSPQPCWQPVIFFFHGIRADEGGQSTVSSYKKLMSDPDHEECKKSHYTAVNAVKIITVSAPKMEPAYWRKAPRRQCCKVIDKSSKNGVLHLQIKSCSRQA